MQTFLPYPCFVRSAEALDSRRLGNQRNETKVIYNALRVGEGGWYNHTATQMWKGYEVALLYYGIAICIEWRRRGHNDTQLEVFFDLVSRNADRLRFPPWFGDPRLHLSHQSNLIRKDPTHYRHQFPGVPDDLPYWWPTKENNE